MEAEKGTPTLRRNRSEVSPNTALPTFTEVTSEASPKSPPKRRRTQLRSFAEVTSEASPNSLRSPSSPKSLPKIRRSVLRSFGELSPRSFAEVTSEDSAKHSPNSFRSQLRSLAEFAHKLCFQRLSVSPFSAAAAYSLRGWGCSKLNTCCNHPGPLQEFYGVLIVCYVTR